MIDKERVNEKIGAFAKNAEKIATNVVDKTKETVSKSKDTVVGVMDVNGDGKVNIEDVIVLGLKTPGVRVNREEFLLKEFEKNYSYATVKKAIMSTPASAGISNDDINRIADDVIKFEQKCTTGMAVGLGIPGGAAMAAAIPADIIQYYGYLLRASQKLMYLYGFPQIDVKEEGQNFDSETLNILIVCFGVMYGVAGANQAIKAMAKALANGVEKKLLRAALMKGTIYPIVKNVSKWFGVRMTKEVFAGFFKKAIPIVGGAINGGIAYLSFKPCCDRLKESLLDTYLSNPQHRETENEDMIIIESDE